LFEVVVAIDQEELIVRPGSPPALQHAIEHGPDDRPDLRPDIPAARTERPWVLGLTEHRAIGVVVQHDEVVPPPDQDGETRPQADIEGGTKAGRPSLYRAERCARPVDGRHELTHVAAAREKLTPSRTLDRR